MKYHNYQKKYLISITIITIVLLSLTIINAQQYNEVDFPSTGSATGAQFAVQVLRYEPYPVNPGDYFNVWIKVQNIGSEPAPNAKFVLSPEYPFTSDDVLVKTYGTISSTTDINQIVLEYRVMAENSAPEGTSDLKLISYTNGNNPNATGVTTDLPIVIGKTNTDFETVMQSSTSQGTSFTLANTGENPATAVSVTIEPEQGLNLTGSSSSIIGNLNSGDFTTVNFQIGQNRDLKEVTLKIDYTNVAGIRESVNETIPVNLVFNDTGTTSSTSRGLPGYIYLIIGIILGIIIVYIYRRIRKKK